MAFSRRLISWGKRRPEGKLTKRSFHPLSDRVQGPVAWPPACGFQLSAGLNRCVDKEFCGVQCRKKIATSAKTTNWRNAKSSQDIDRNRALNPILHWAPPYRISHLASASITLNSWQNRQNWPTRGYTRSYYTGTTTAVLSLSLAALRPHFSLAIFRPVPQLIERLGEARTPFLTPKNYHVPCSCPRSSIGRYHPRSRSIDILVDTGWTSRSILGRPSVEYTLFKSKKPTSPNNTQLISMEGVFVQT